MDIFGTLLTADWFPRNDLSQSVSFLTNFDHIDSTHWLFTKLDFMMKGRGGGAISGTRAPFLVGVLRSSLDIFERDPQSSFTQNSKTFGPETAEILQPKS